MRKTITFLVMFIFCTMLARGQTPFSGTSGNFTSDSKLPLVEVLAPNGGETFNYLEPLSVTWTATDESFGTNPISIGISTEAGGAYTIVASNLPNSGSASVNPPGVVTGYAKVKVIAVDTFGIEGEDESDDHFTLDESFSGTSVSFITDSKLPVVTVNSPNGGESYGYLEPLEVSWTATDDSFGATPISIGISTEVGGAFTIVASNLPNTGSATVTPPGIATGYAKVQVIAMDDFGLEGPDESDSSFTFENYFIGTSANFISDSKPPVVSVITPNGGEAYYFADPLQVKWDATDDSFGAIPVSISMSTDGGATYSDVASGLHNTDSAYVTAPQEITDLAMVKVFVQDEFGLTAFDESDAVFTLHGVYVDLTAFLQGPFAGTGMLTFLNMQGFLPTSQPYGAAPWNYSGTETADPIPNNNVVDWVLIEIREAPDAASATEATILAQRAGFVLNNGTVTDVDGTIYLQFGIEVNNNLFAMVHHRNHLAIMSAYPLTEAAGVYSYDYTTAADKVYGGAIAHSQLVPGIWGMTAGDANADGDIDNIDKDDIWLPDLYSSGYYPGDFNLSGYVLDNDKQTLWEPNSGKSRKQP